MKLKFWEKTKPTAKTSENFKAAYDKQATAKPTRKVFHLGENSWTARYQHYSKLREAYPLFDKAVLAAAGLVMSQGVYHRPAERKPTKKADSDIAKMDNTEAAHLNEQAESFANAEDAAYRADQFRDKHYVNTKLFQTTVQICAYGSCFWELSDNETYDFRIPPLQEYIEPAEADTEGNITKWRQVINGTKLAEWTSNQLKLISWNVTTSTWPYGNGLGVGLETELEMLIDVETSVKDYSEKAAWPYEVFQLGDGGQVISDSDYNIADSLWKNRKAGQGFTTRNMPVQILQGGTNSAPIRELAALCELMKDNVHDGLVVPPVSKLYNSTEASATVLTKHVMTVLGQPIQWLLKEHYESDVLKQLMVRQGFSVKACPIALFESPDVHKKEEGEYWVSLVTAQIQTPMQAAEHLGLEYDEDYFVKKKEEMQLQQDKLAGAKPKEEAPAQKTGEIVWEVRKKTKPTG